MGRPLKYLRPEEIKGKWRKYYDFKQQAPRTRPDGKKRDLYIQVECPECGTQRWNRVINIRRKFKTPYCHSCAITGAQNPNWRGGRYYNTGGYIIQHVGALQPPDRALAEVMANSDGYVLEHRLVIARSLNRPLRSDEVVHHVNGVKDDNRLENLRLLKVHRHNQGHGDLYYQKWQEALSEIKRLKEQLCAITK